MKKLFTTAFLFAALGSMAQTTLPTAWNFSNPGVATPPTGWTYAVGTNGNLTYAFGKGDALAARLDATGEYVMIQFTDKPGQLSYYLSPQNAGNPWGGQFDIQESPDGSSWTTLRSVTSKATTATNFNDPVYIENLNSASRYVRFYYTTKLPGGQATPGGNMALDSVRITPAPVSTNASINVKYGAADAVIGSTIIVGKTVTNTFAIQNKGTTQSLTIDSVQFEGVAAADYNAGTLPGAIAGNGTANLNVTFTAGPAGSRIATMKIYSNDAEKSPYVLTLYGISGNLATEPNQQAGNWVFNNVKTFAFDGKFDAPVSNAPEHYIVLRKIGGPVNANPVDATTYKRGDYIGGCQVAYIGDTTTTLHPTYIWANTNYFYQVFSFNGPAGFENYLTANPSTGSVTTPGKTMNNYYTGINSDASNFVTQLSAKINPHDTVFYSLYIGRFVNPYLTRDTSNGQKVVNCVYTEQAQVYDEPFLWWTGSNNAILTREHTFAQSWMPTRSLPSWPNGANGKELPEYNDLHHLFPADQVAANGQRSNYPFGEIVGTPTYVSPTGMGKLGLNADGKTVWEPRDEQKGDVARALFYMCTAYNGINGNSWHLPANISGSVPYGQDQAVLKKWHFQDLPDNFEIARHEYVYSQQHNRNPFIDSVNFVCRIDFTNMSWIANPGNCGVVENDTSIQITTPVGGEIWHTGTPGVIAWTSSNIDSVEIELVTIEGADTLYQEIGTVAASPGIYSWLIPTSTSITGHAKIVLHRGSRASASPAFFTITNAALQITAPVGGEHWHAAPNNITWTSTSVDSIKIDLWIADTLYQNITTTSASGGSYNWTVLPANLNSSLAKIKLSDTKSSLSSTSPGYFMIMGPVNGVDELICAKDISVYPNPSKGYFNISTRNAGVKQIVIRDLMGKEIKTIPAGNLSAVEFNISQSGVYFVEVVTEKGNAFKKLIVE